MLIKNIQWNRTAEALKLSATVILEHAPATTTSSTDP